MFTQFARLHRVNSDNFLTWFVITWFLIYLFNYLLNYLLTYVAGGPSKLQNRTNANNGRPRTTELTNSYGRTMFVSTEEMVSRRAGPHPLHLWHISSPNYIAKVHPRMDYERVSSRPCQPKYILSPNQYNLWFVSFEQIRSDLSISGVRSEQEFTVRTLWVHYSRTSGLFRHHYFRGG